MKINIYFLIFLSVFFNTVYAQNKPIAEKIQQSRKNNQNFTKVELFGLNDSKTQSQNYTKAAKDVTVLNLNAQELRELISKKPNIIELSIPYNGTQITLELIKQEIFTEDFIAKNEKGETINYNPGIYYQGIIKGDHASLVGFSFFENDVIGIASSSSLGNLSVGKTKDKQDFVAYLDKNILGANPFVCGVDELPENKEIQSFNPEMLDKADMTNNCVRIYYEIANAPFQENGSSETETMNWITAIHNNINTLYTNDNIKIALSEVMIWTTEDPYDGDYSQNLHEFTETRTSFNGDLAHLVNYPATTSVAFLNSLCGKFRYAYSGVNMFFEEVPTYSWTVTVLTHEMGHVMGSPHTHACAWNGNNTAIDGCGPASGYNEGCDAPLPENGGTIMSYCHQIDDVGVNLNNGFGAQPAALIRNTIDSKACIGTDCISSCPSTIENVSIQQLDPTNFQVSISDNVSTQWAYRIFEYEALPSDWIESNSPVLNLEVQHAHKYYWLEIINKCPNGLEGTTTKLTIVLSGDFCDGTLFTDTGGVTGNYGSRQNFIKTFYPSGENNAVQLSFSRIALKTNEDFMYVHNGDSVDSPLFDGGIITSGHNPGPSFISTNDTGAVTIHFVSTSLVTWYGWEATVNCGVMSIEDNDLSSDVSVYPNPTSSVLNIDAKKEIISVKLNDVSGKSILSKKSNALKETLNIQHLPKGVYILTVEMKGQTTTKKIIKN